MIAERKYLADKWLPADFTSDHVNAAQNRANPLKTFIETLSTYSTSAPVKGNRYFRKYFHSINPWTVGTSRREWWYDNITDEWKLLGNLGALTLIGWCYDRHVRVATTVVIRSLHGSPACTLATGRSNCTFVCNERNFFSKQITHIMTNAN